MTSPIIIVLSGGIFVYDTAHVCIYVRHSNDLQLERGLFLQVGLKTFWRHFCTEGRKTKGVAVTVQSVDVAFILI